MFLPAPASVVEEAIGGLVIAAVKDVVAAKGVGAEAIGGLAIASVKDVVAGKGVVAAKGARELAGAKGREVLEAGTAERPAEVRQH